MKKIFKLIYDNESVDNSIVPYSKELYGIKKYDVTYHAPLLDLDPRNYFYWDDPENECFLDYLANDLGWPLMSEKMKNIIETYCKDDVRFFPINIVNTVNNKKITYYLLNIVKSFYSSEVLDIQNSKHSNIDNNLIIFVYCFYKQKIKGAKLFRIAGYETRSL